MIYPHLKNDLKTIKSYVNKTQKVVWYQDQIQDGYSLKIEYLQRDAAQAINTFNRLRRRFPDKNVRLLEPTEDRRRYGSYAVRIWVK